MQMNELGFYTSAGAPKLPRDLIDELQKNILSSRQRRQKKCLI